MEERPAPGVVAEDGKVHRLNTLAARRVHA